MKKKQADLPTLRRLFIKSVHSFALAALLLMGSCTSTEQKEMDIAKDEIAKGHFQIGLNHLEKVIVRKPNSNIGIEAAREAARVSYYETKDFRKAIRYYRLIVVNSRDPDQRLLAQKQIVSIYFDQLTDYPNAVIEINKLVMMLTDIKELTSYKMKLARAYYYQNNFTQAENETDEFLRLYPNSEQRFDVLFLKGNISLANKDLLSAVEIFKNLVQEFPERASKDNVGLTLSVCYEEMKDFKSAIDTLEKIKASHPMPEYIDIRIQRLKERMKNAPGARGKIRK